MPTKPCQRSPLVLRRCPQKNTMAAPSTPNEITIDLSVSCSISSLGTPKDGARNMASASSAVVPPAATPSPGKAGWGGVAGAVKVVAVGGGVTVGLAVGVAVATAGVDARFFLLMACDGWQTSGSKPDHHVLMRDAHIIIKIATRLVALAGVEADGAALGGEDQLGVGRVRGRLASGLAALGGPGQSRAGV